MKYRTIGQNGPTISRIIVGTTMFGELMDDAEARAVLHAAWDHGITTIDTANIYAAGRSEEMVGRIIAGRRENLTLCTKVGFRVGDGPAEHARSLAGKPSADAEQEKARRERGLGRRHIMGAVEASLLRLRTDHIDLYQAHRWDPEIPIEETLRAFEDLRSSGKILSFGLSNATAHQLGCAVDAAHRLDLSPPASMQVPYSLLTREPETDVLPFCLDKGVSCIAYSSLAGGALSLRHRDGVVPSTVMAQRPAYQQRMAANSAKIDRFAAIAETSNRRPVSLAIAAVLGHPAVAAVTLGVQDPNELEDLVAAAAAPLRSDERADLLSKLDAS